MFGDTEAYLEKHKTAARTRPRNLQKLGPDFYELEHTKPLFIKNDIMTVHNLYNYHCLLSVSKSLKFHIPIAIHILFTRSRRKDTLLIAPLKFESFVTSASTLWNTFRSTPEGNKIKDFAIGIAHIKKQIKARIYLKQKLGDEQDWNPEINFSIG